MTRYDQLRQIALSDNITSGQAGAWAQVQLPPLGNWDSLDLGYGFFLDYSQDFDYVTRRSTGSSPVLVPEREDIHVLNLNPQQISYDEPIATAVKLTQDGGKYVESRGGVRKTLTIRGTTGFLPPVRPGFGRSQRPNLQARGLYKGVNATNGEAVSVEYAASSGFAEFYRLRALFRRFMVERRAGRNVNMHWMDFTANEFWRIEPMRFSMDRSLQHRVTRPYMIQVELLEPSEDTVLVGKYEGPGVNRALLTDGYSIPDLVGDSKIRKAIARMKGLRKRGNDFARRFLTGNTKLKWLECLDAIAEIERWANDLAYTRRTALELPLSLYRQLLAALTGLSEGLADNTPSAIRYDANRWWLEVRFLTEGAIAHHQRLYGSTPGNEVYAEHVSMRTLRGAEGVSSDFMEADTNTALIGASNPFAPSRGLDFVTQLERVVSTTALRPEAVLTNETIFDVARRLLGDANRFIDLVILNQLKPPFIAGDKTNKPPGTVAWGEPIGIPVSGTDSLVSQLPVDPATSTATGEAASGTTTTITDLTKTYDWVDDVWAGFTVEYTSGTLLGEKRVIRTNDADTLTVHRAFTGTPAPADTYKIYLETFSRRRGVSPETRAFGRDILAVFTTTNGLVREGVVDTMLGPTGDLAQVQGTDNFEQAITLRMITELGDLPAHPEYGVAFSIGRPFDPAAVALFVFYLRRGLYSDPRVAKVEQSRVQFEGGVLRAEMQVTPVRAQKAVKFATAV